MDPQCHANTFNYPTGTSKDTQGAVQVKSGSCSRVKGEVVVGGQTDTGLLGDPVVSARRMGDLLRSDPATARDIQLLPNKTNLMLV